MHARTALLMLDMVSTFDFPRGPALRRAAETIAPRLERLKTRVKSAGGLCIYANDNFADWTTDFQGLLALARGSRGQRVLEALPPQADDLHVLKPRHSAFHQTALEFLLRKASVERVLLTGLSTEACVLATALDAHIRDFETCVVSDCVGSSSPQRRGHALSVLRYNNVHATAALKVRLP